MEKDSNNLNRSPRKGSRNYRIDDGRGEDRHAEQRKTAAALAYLVARPEYAYLKELGGAIADADFIPAPKNLDEAIRFHFWATRKAAIETLFRAVEATAKSATRLSAEKRVGEKDTKSRASLFSEKEFNDL